MVQEIYTTLFYVDDDADDLEFFKEAVEDIGKNVSLFALGEDLLHAMHNPPPMPAVVFLDLNMPIKSGFDILDEIKNNMNFDGIPVVVLSTASDHNTINRCWDLGADLYVSKATSIRDLKQVIAHVLTIDWEDYGRRREEFVYRK